MNITDVRVKFVGNNSERLKAFCSVTMDGDFVVRDLKIIEGTNGPFVAMPSRKLADRCSKCGCKNNLRARYCNECGVRLLDDRVPCDDQGRVKLHADVAHPITIAGRSHLQEAVLKAYEAEVGQPRKSADEPTVDENSIAADFSEDAESGFSDSSETAAPPFSAYEELVADLKGSAVRRAAARKERDQVRDVWEKSQETTVPQVPHDKPPVSTPKHSCSSTVVNRSEETSAEPIDDGFASGIL